MNWNMWWGRRAYKEIAARVWNCGLYTGGKATIGFGWQDRNVKKKLLLHSTALHPPYVIFLETHQTAFQILLQLFFVPFQYDGYKAWRMLKPLTWFKILTYFLVKRVRMLKNGILGPSQGKMEVLQVPRERKNSHFSCGANLVQEQSKSMIKATAV